MVDNTGIISTMATTPTAQIDDGNDAIHSGILMALSAATGENRAVDGFNVSQSITSPTETYTRYDVTAGHVLRNGKLETVATKTGATGLDTTSTTGTSNTSKDWYGLIVVDASNVLQWRHGTASPTSTGKLDDATATVAALTTGDIPIAVVKYVAGSDADLTNRPIQFLSYLQSTRAFSALSSAGTESMRINADGTITIDGKTITLPTSTGTLALQNENTSGTAGGLSSTLAVSSGGTGQTSYTNGQLLIGNTSGNTLAKAALTAGTNVSITNGAGSISIAATDTTYSVFTGADGSSAGTTGLVKQPAATDNAKFLKGDSTWAVPTNTTYSTFDNDGGGLVPSPASSGTTVKFLREDALGLFQLIPIQNILRHKCILSLRLIQLTMHNSVLMLL